MNIFHLLGAALFGLGFAINKKAGTKIATKVDIPAKTMPKLNPESEIMPKPEISPESEPEPNHEPEGDNPNNSN